MEVGGKHLHISSAGAVVCLEDQRLVTNNFAAPARIGMGHCEITVFDDLDLIVYQPVVGQGKGGTAMARRPVWDGDELKFEDVWSIDMKALKKGKGKIGFGFSCARIGDLLYGENIVIDVKVERRSMLEPPRPAGYVQQPKPIPLAGRGTVQNTALFMPLLMMAARRCAHPSVNFHRHCLTL